MLNLDPFVWWIITISWSIAFLIVIGIYLYADSRKRRDDVEKKRSVVRLGKDFVFVMILLGLLVFYVFSVNMGSSFIFAAGNIAVEVILIIYLVRNSSGKADQKKKE